LIDREALNRLQEWGGPKLVREMIRLYLDNSPERLDQIQQGFDEHELNAVERAAHSLKSSSANVGALDVSRLAERLEHLADSGSDAEARQLHPELTSAWELARGALEEFLEGADA
jgi:HPt (histidine-containing phosphotransfer) domain-containing protein